jgi:hypothetical protein
MAPSNESLLEQGMRTAVDLTHKSEVPVQSETKSEVGPSTQSEDQNTAINMFSIDEYLPHDETIEDCKTRLMCLIDPGMM